MCHDHRRVDCLFQELIRASPIILFRKPLAEGESAATLKDVSVGKVYVDFGGAAVKGTTSLIAKVGTGVTGTMAGKTFRAKAVNTGDASLKAADCTVDDAGNVFATPVPLGLLIMVR